MTLRYGHTHVHLARFALQVQARTKYERVYLVMPIRVLLASFVRRHQHPQRGLELARHLFSVQKEQPTQDLLKRDRMPSILVQSNRRPACQDFMRLRYKQHSVSLFHPESSLSIFVTDQTNVNRMFLCLFLAPKVMNVLLEHLAVSSIFPLIL